MSTASRRDVSQDRHRSRGGGRLAAAGAGLPSKTITLLRETSFIKTFDEYMQNTLVPAYEKEAGVKVVYELTSVGSLPTRTSTIIETGSGADVTMIFLLYPFLYSRKTDGCQRHRRGSRQIAGRLVRRGQGGRQSSTANGRQFRTAISAS